MRRAQVPILAFLLTLALAPGPARAELLELVAEGLDAPTGLAHAGDARLFVLERRGSVRIVEGGVVRPAPFLDLSERVDTSGEGGLLGLAFDPGFASNGAFYVSYTTHDLGEGFTSIVSRFHVSVDPDVADAAEDVMLRLRQPFTNHDGGNLAFGPDGHLYVGFGDGGDANDPGCRAQKGATWLGKLLRIAPVPSGGAAPFYAIPPDNPFADPGDGVLDEILDFGLRNPWRFSFDRASGDLWIGDVGQNAIEEVDLRPAWGASPPGSKNWGWKVMEGRRCSNPGAESCPADTPRCGAPEYEPPVDQYAHKEGNRAITGGYVYRGALAPAFVGAYVFGDFGSGRLFVLRAAGDGRYRRATLLAQGPHWSSFGEGPDGELYGLDLPGGRVFRLNLAAARTRGDRRCIVGMNQAFARGEAARARQLARCAARAAEGDGSAEACAAESDARVAKAAARTERVAAERCDVAPPFGASDAATVNAAALAAPLGLLRDVLGPEIDAALVAGAADAVGARCQAELVARLQRCSARRTAEFVRCKEAGLRDASIDGAAALAACLEADPKGRRGAACAGEGGAVAAPALAQVCAPTPRSLGVLFPGCAAARAEDLAACVERAGRCRSCLALSAADALGADCDAYDDGALDASCP